MSTDKWNKIYRDLSTTLFYPAVLGYFIFQIMRLVFSHTTYETFAQQPLFVIGKVLLVLETLLFYCCDFLGASYLQKYKWGSLLTDLVIMAIVISIFKALGFSDTFDIECLNIDRFCIGFGVFMGVYLIRYFIKKNKGGFDSDEEKKRYTSLAYLEAGALGALIFIIFLEKVLKVPRIYLLYVLAIPMPYLIYRYRRQVLVLFDEFCRQ